MYYCTTYATANKKKVPYGHSEYWFAVRSVEAQDTPCAATKNEDANAAEWVYTAPLKFNLATSNWKGETTPGFGRYANLASAEPSQSGYYVEPWFWAVFGIICAALAIFVVMFVWYYYRYKHSKSKLLKCRASASTK